MGDSLYTYVRSTYVVRTYVPEHVMLRDVDRNVAGFLLGQLSFICCEGLTVQELKP